MASGLAAHILETPEAEPGHARRGPPRLVLIAGGGIGGLAAALALAKAGIASHVLERRTAFSEDGAGIQIGPHGTRILAGLGAADALAPLVAAPDALRVLDAISGRSVQRMPLGRWIAERHGAPYWVAHRQDLHGALLARARSEPLIRLTTGADITSADTGESQVRARSPNGPVNGDALIAAQGLWSPLRAAYFDARPPRFAGKTAARAVVAMARDMDETWRRDVCLWLAPGAHVVHYPVRGGQELAMVAIFADGNASKAWSLPVERDAILGRAGAFAAPLRRLLEQPETWRCWSLHTLARLPAFARGRIALLGDAAHPVLPFLAQGAMLALEDAVVLAKALAAHGNIEEALGAYARRRRGRVRRVALASRLNGSLYELSGVLASARNAGLAAAPQERLMAGYDWLYGWKE